MGRERICVTFAPQMTERDDGVEKPAHRRGMSLSLSCDSFGGSGT